MPTLPRVFSILYQLLGLPLATLTFFEELDSPRIKATYEQYTKPHPRYRFIRNKTLGAALIDLSKLDSIDKYEALIRKTNALAYIKRAHRRGFTCIEIDRNAYIEDIHRINNSCLYRQGRPMDFSYRQKINSFGRLSHFRHFGIVDDDQLVAYADIGLYGNFYGFSRLIGVRNNDGIMHLLLFEILSRLIHEKDVQYVMYDTYFGALPGLRQFKFMLGFRPYRVKYFLL